MNTPLIQWIAAALFGVALLHTFSVKFFERLSHRYPRHAGLFQLLGEVEVVFGFWAMVLIVAMALAVGGPQALQYAESRNYTEPLFVFVVMVIAASRPVLRTVVAIVHTLAKLAPVPTPLATAWLGLAAVPLLGWALPVGISLPGIDWPGLAGSMVAWLRPTDTVDEALAPTRPARA